MIAIGAIFKNECAYITEWIAYYKMLGFNRIYIVDNVSTDGSSELLSRLHENGEIIRIEYQTVEGIKPQIHAYNLILDRAVHECDYIAFFDADEFLAFSDGDQNINSLVEFMNSKENIGAVAISWCMYGSSHAILPGQGLIIERFDQHAEKNSHLNLYYKSFLRTRAINRNENAGVHSFPLKEGFKTVLTDGTEINSTSGRSEHVSWELCRLNHYVIKSNSEFYRKKMSRGRAAGNNDDLNKYFFKNHDRNDQKSNFNSKVISKLKYNKHILEKKSLFKDDAFTHPPLYRRSDIMKGISYIDSLTVINSALIFDGWCSYSGGDIIENICLVLNKLEYVISSNFTKKKRSDVVSSGISDYEMCGFIATFDLSLIVCGNVKFIDVYAIDAHGDVVHEFVYENKIDVLKGLFPQLSVKS